MTLPLPSSSSPVWIFTPVVPRLSCSEPRPLEAVSPTLAAAMELLAVAA